LETTVPTHTREDARGTLVEIVNSGPWETVLTGRMHAGAVLGNHYHKTTRMLFYLIAGAAEVHLFDVRTERRSQGRVLEGEGLYLEPNTAHALRFEVDSAFLLLKSRRYQAHEPDTFPFAVLES
jgi:quercetin dioxygenase-like cupin family protein